MLYYFEKYELSILVYPGITQDQEALVDFLVSKYEETSENRVKKIDITPLTYEKINNLPINLRIKTRISFIQNPLARIYNIFKFISKNKIYEKHPDLKNEKVYLNLLSQHRQNNIDFFKNKYDGIFNKLLYILSDNSNVINYDMIIKENIFIDDLMLLINKFDGLFTKEDAMKHIEKTNKILPDDYMVNYNDNIIKLIYDVYYEDFSYFGYPLHKVDMSTIKISKNTNSNISPIFTIITPTVGTPSLLRLKKALSYENVPFIHLILWDKNRIKNALNPIDLEDDRTFCYEFTHPYHEFPNQRNDVWLRGVGITLVNTPFVTFFDDDTWPDRGHLDNIYKHMINNKLEYTFCKRRMWEFDEQHKNNNLNGITDNYGDLFNNLKLIGTDNFESIGVESKMGYRLVDNSSLYMRLDTAREISSVFLKNQYYGDDRETPKHLDKFKGGIYNNVLVNHVAKPKLVNFFRNNILSL